MTAENTGVAQGLVSFHAMPMTPEEISGAKLPRSLFGGLNRKAVQEFLKRVAWEYAEATHRAKEHEETPNPMTQRVAELEAQVRSLQTELDSRKDPTEIAQTLLGVARQSSQQLRENARKEAEAMLRKARSRAQEIEEEAVRRAQTSSEDLERLIALRRRVRDEVQAALETLAATDPLGEEQPHTTPRAQSKATDA